MNTFIDPKAKLFQHMDRLHAIRQGGRPAPVNVELFLSNRCSHGCSWCHYAHTHTKGPLAGKAAKPPGAMGSGDLMDAELARYILWQLSDAGVKSVTFSGGGEPTLHPDFGELVEYAAGQKLEQGLYTHGGHLAKAGLAETVKQHCTWVYISLDECTRDAFKHSKGVDRYDAVLDGVRALVAAEGKATVGLGFLLHRDNFADVGRMVALGRELGVDYVQFRPTVQYDQAQPGKLSEDTAWISWAVGHLHAYEFDPFVVVDVERFRMYARWTSHGYATCYGSALQTAISPNGMMWRCTNKTEYPDALLGDLSVEPFSEIWARSGGPCAVNRQCRIMCRQHISNLTLDKLMVKMPHANFI